ncbi:MAG: flippase [Candidatus Paceibacterota bacterium]
MISKLKTFLFQNLTPRQTVTKNIFWLSVSQVGSRIFRAIIIIYAARVLGATEYGLFAYVLGFAGIFAIFSDIGVNALLTRDTASHPEERTKYFSTSFWIKLFLLTISAILVIFAASHFSRIEKAVYLFPLVALIVVFDGLREFAGSFLRGLEKMEWEAFIIITMNAVIAIAGFIFLNISPTSKSLIFSYIASVGFAALLALLIVKNQISKVFDFKRYFDKKLAFQIINSAWPIAFWNILGVLMLNIDVVMLGWWRTATEIGYYSIGQRFVQVLYTLPALLASGIFPALSRFIKDKDQAREKNLNEKSLTFVFFLALPFVMGGIILARPIISMVFGSGYLPGVPAFQILMASLLFIFPSVILSNLVIAHNHQKKVVGFLIFGTITNIVLNSILIPALGIVGAAIAYLASQMVYVAPIWLKVRQISDFHVLRYLKKIIAVAIIMGGLSFILNHFGTNVILNIVISAGFYLGTLYVLKERIWEEILILFKKFREAPSQ